MKGCLTVATYRSGIAIQADFKAFRTLPALKESQIGTPLGVNLGKYKLSDCMNVFVSPASLPTFYAIEILY